MQQPAASVSRPKPPAAFAPVLLTQGQTQIISPSIDMWQKISSHHLVSLTGVHYANNFESAQMIGLMVILALTTEREDMDFP
jgi:hypothetical protein